MEQMGYQDCMDETMRFLTEVEGFKTDDPVVIGLLQHLGNHQNNLEFSHQNDVESCTDAMPSIIGSTNGPTIEQHHCDSSSTYTDATHLHTTENYTLDSYLPSHFGESTNGILDENMNEISSDHLFKYLDFSQLVQTNPAIASVTEELIGLLTMEACDNEENES